MQLSWTAASDNSGVTGYDILRNGQVVGSTSGEVLFYSDAGLPAGSSFLYTVRARDGQGNISPPSMVVSAVVLDRGDSQAPEAPTGLKQIGATASSLSMGWTASRDNVGVTGYEIVRNGLSIAITDGTTLRFTDSGLIAGTRYTYAVRARDAAGNWSVPSAGLTFTPGSSAVTDLQAPTTPNNLKLDGATHNSVSLSWAASSDDVGVTRYDLYRNGSLLISLGANTLSYVNTGLSPATAYSYAVLARDAVGHASSLSNPLVATTLAQATLDTQAPTAPADLVAADVGPNSLSLSWSAATDNVGVAGYDIYRGGLVIASVGGSTLSHADAT
ncbi:MAG: fibronectin type III domain-containing protein [Uliginosibacterium sp.]|nr:fibronectin type III domain-containing protein [Uliginosibacterium sp.]